MKILLPFLLFELISYSNVFSQANIYHPFPDSGALWTTAHLDVPGCLDNPCDYEFYMIGTDTIFDNLNYRKLLVEGTLTFGPDGPTYNAPHFTYIIVRDDTLNKKFYLRDVFGDHDDLVYDFSLQKGDTLPDAYVSSKAQGVYIMDIDSVLIEDSTYRKRYKLNSIEYGSIYDSLTLIEGIGYTGGFLKLIHQYVGFEGGFHLACFNDGESPKYLSQYFEPVTCALPTGLQGITQLQIKIFPVPVKRGDPVYFSGVKEQDEVYIFDVFGRLLKSDHLRNLNGTGLFLPSDYPGIYICKIWVMDSNRFVVKKLIVE